MKKTFLLLFLTALLLSAAAKTIRFTIVNKSNREMVVHLTSVQYPMHNPYIFTVAPGTRENPQEADFHIQPGAYFIDVYTPDGIWCIPEKLPDKYKRIPVSIKHNMKLVLLPCFTVPKVKSGAAALKWYHPRYYYEKSKR